MLDEKSMFFSSQIKREQESLSPSMRDALESYFVPRNINERRCISSRRYRLTLLSKVTRKLPLKQEAFDQLAT